MLIAADIHTSDDQHNFVFMKKEKIPTLRSEPYQAAKLYVPPADEWVDPTPEEVLQKRKALAKQHAEKSNAYRTRAHLANLYGEQKLLDSSWVSRMVAIPRKTICDNKNQQWDDSETFEEVPYGPSVVATGSSSSTFVGSPTSKADLEQSKGGVESSLWLRRRLSKKGISTSKP